LMEAFYRHLQDGLTNAEALRAAQLDVLAREEWQTPYYWAAFSLTGDYKGNGEPRMVIEEAPEPTATVAPEQTPTSTPPVETATAVSVAETAIHTPTVEPKPTPNGGGGGPCGSAALPLSAVLLAGVFHLQVRRKVRW